MPSMVVGEGVAAEVADEAVELPDPEVRVTEPEADPLADAETWTLLVLDWEAVELLL